MLLKLESLTYIMPLTVCVYLRSNFSAGRHNFLQDFSILKGHFGRSKSSKVTDTGANRKRIVEFLLVCNSNFGPILHRFRDMTAFMCSWLHPYFTLILGVFPLHRIAHVGVSQSRGLQLFGREIIFKEFKPMWSWYLIVTDRRTDDLLSHHRALR